jgi:tRNA(His) 5'-end guanylyltransferase
MDTQSLGEDLKSKYEDRSRFYLPRRAYTVIRIDGKAFSSYTRQLAKPYDLALVDDFNVVTQALCSEVQTCKFGYTQSDEITLVLSDFESPNTEAWFDGNLQKIASVSASIATAYFAKARQRHGDDRIALFDARCFSISSHDEVRRCLLWRQQDAMRNSILNIGRTVLSHKEMQGMSVSDIRQALPEKGVDLEHYSAGILRGRAVVKESYEAPIPSERQTLGGEISVQRTRWTVLDAPFFSEPNSVSEYIPFHERSPRA